MQTSIEIVVYCAAFLQEYYRLKGKQGSIQCEQQLSCTRIPNPIEGAVRPAAAGTTAVGEEIKS